MQQIDLLIVGGGPAGLAAAIAAKDAGATDILILEREEALGGILKQCIHNGFGLQIFNEELTGPEYADRYVRQVIDAKIPYWLETMVIDISPEKVVTAVSKQKGLVQLQAKAIVLAMGCRERPRGALGTPGTRPSGIFSAGTAQKFVNLEGFLPGKEVVILGSGDIGLIMARRLTFEGCTVKACVELLPYSSGLKRNVVQCLDDFGIPLLLSHTIIDIHGKDRLAGVTIAKVDDSLTPIMNTAQYIACDTLLLSVGLVPENELSKEAGVQLSEITKGPIVDQNLQTNVPGIFAAGNVLHVHDLVDFVSEEAALAGKEAAQYIQKMALPKPEPTLCVQDGFGVRGCVPQKIARNYKKPVKIMFRPDGIYENVRICAMAGGSVLQRGRLQRVVMPGEMRELTIDFSTVSLEQSETVTVFLEAQNNAN